MASKSKKIVKKVEGEVLTGIAPVEAEVNPPTTAEPEQRITVTITNSDEEIRAALLAVGVKLPAEVERDMLIHYAEQAKIWVQVKRSVVPDSYKTRYRQETGEDNCGDDVAEVLKGHDVYEVMGQNGIPLDRWAGRNPGMVRMNLGNVLRGRIKRGEYVVVGSFVWNKDAKPEAA